MPAGAQKEYWCLTCGSAKCTGGDTCAHLSVSDDGTVAITMRRRLTKEERSSLQKNGRLLSVAEKLVRSHWLHAISGGTWVGTMDVMEEVDGAFEGVKRILKLRGEALAKTLLVTTFRDLYGRYNVLDWPEGIPIDEQVEKFSRQADRATSCEKARRDFVGHVHAAARAARRAAKTGLVEDAAEMTGHAQRAVRSWLLFDPEPEPSEIAELDAEIEEVSSLSRTRLRAVE